MSISLSAREEEALYVVLKPQESTLDGTLDALLRRVERSLFERMTIEEIEGLAARFKRDR